MNFRTPCQEDALLRESYVILGPGYTEHQRQRFDISVMTLATVFSLKTMESLENGLRLQPGVTPLFSMKAVSVALLQHWCGRLV